MHIISATATIKIPKQLQLIIQKRRHNEIIKKFQKKAGKEEKGNKAQIGT